MSAFDESEKAAVYWVLSKLESTEYRFQCLNFVEDAYEKGAGMEFAGYYYTKEVADKLDVGRNTGVPLFGAFVFYDCWGIINGKYRNWGACRTVDRRRQGGSRFGQGSCQQLHGCLEPAGSGGMDKPSICWVGSGRGVSTRQKTW